MGHAFRQEAGRHEHDATWLARLVAGDDQLAPHHHVLAGFVRIVTDRKIVPTPAPTSLALEFVTRMCSARHARWLPTGNASWERLQMLVSGDRGIVGVVPDAHLAAVALTHGCRSATADRGLARFPGLDWFDLAAHRNANRTGTDDVPSAPALRENAVSRRRTLRPGGPRPGADQP